MTVESAAAFAGGHLFFVRDGTLMAQAFDPASQHLTGDAFPVAEAVGTEGSRYGPFSVSDTGALVYGRGEAGGASRLVWLDRNGKQIGTLGEPSRYMSVSLSPDGRHVAVSLDGDVWIIDVARGVSSRLTFDPGIEDNPVWSPDSARVAFRSGRNGERGLRVKPANGAGADEGVLSSDAATPSSGLPTAEDWSRDGRFIIYSLTSILPANSLDLWLLPMPESGPSSALRPDAASGRKPFAFAQGPGTQTHGAFSPDGHWIAYVSDESSIRQVYVQPFPATGGRFQVSKDGGQQPQWRGDGKELFFLAPDGTLMVSPIEATRDFQAGIPAALFNSGGAPNARRQYAVTRDGQRFLVNVPARGPSTAQPLTVVVNWLAAVQK
jgi:Tol biopolymer transport system component